MNGATWIVKALQKIGVQYVFALCGNGLHTFLASCRDEGLAVIDCHNEQAAAFMAEGWGRLTGTLGVVAVSSGPGFTNTITGTANAFWDGSPMLFISGASSELTKGLEHFQEMDQERMVEPICKYVARVTHGEQIPHQFQRAVAAAVQGRPGPVHLTITDNAFDEEIPA
ncbi:MAG: thiamine pyrophosphate-binding protein, partial [Limnochordia bacterium]